MLTDDQVKQFETFGFVLLPQAFSAVEVAQIEKHFEDGFKETIAECPVETEHVLDYFIEPRPALAQLVDDDRIYEAMGQLLGPRFIWSCSEGHRGITPEYTSHHWHADRPGKNEATYRRIKIMLYLEPLRKDTGALRVIPGSHRSPLHEDLLPFVAAHVKDNPTFFGMKGPDVPCFPLKTDPGDMVIFHQSLYHAVYGKTGIRRYIALKFAGRPTCDAHIASLKKHSAHALAPHEAFVRSSSPRIQGMVEGLAELAV